MIAKPDQHFPPQTLRQLLDESLSREDERAVQMHLNECVSCQDALKQLAGDADWWSETAEILTDSTRANRDDLQLHRASPPESDLDASIEWIRPLLSAATSDMPGCLGCIDQYPVMRVIGQGGMGVVLHAIDTELGRPIAIKVLSPHLAGVGAARQRFMREAQAVATVIHPSIVPIYSVVSSVRLPYIVMPLITGGNLQQRIDEEGPLELAEILRIGLQIAEGLAAAHRHGIVHRDIKPANILVEEGNGRVLVSDFGLARVVDDATLTHSGMLAGTPAFMSPEQARGENLDRRSDVFSLGSLLYCLAIGRPPFRAETPLAILRKISDSKPRPVRQINERMPEWFDHLLEKLMHPNLSHRIDSADAAAELLRDGLAHVRNPTRHALCRDLQPSTQRRRTGFAAAGLATGLLAVLLFALTVFKEPRPARKADESIDQSATRLAEQTASTANRSADSSSVPSQVNLDDWFNQVQMMELREISDQINELNRQFETSNSKMLPFVFPQSSFSSDPQPSTENSESESQSNNR